MKHLNIGSTIKAQGTEAWIDNNDGKGKQYLIKGGQHVGDSNNQSIENVKRLQTGNTQ